MPKKSGGDHKMALVIVESPAKARTIGGFLGPNYRVEASIGHVRDLPERKTDMPEQYRGESWAYLGVNVDDEFQPIYIVPAEKRQQVNKLKQALRDADELYLATDEDREGEAISWHLTELLNPKVPVHRLVFHEITKEAITEALRSPRSIDDGLVRAQETRRVLDRLYGYDVSPLLWRKIRPGLSAGRVQSVAVRMIVDRERERMAFHSATYWDLSVNLGTDAGETFTAQLVAYNQRKIPAGKDFDPKTGQPRNSELLVLNEVQAAELATKLRSATFRVTELEEKPDISRPYPPFTTSTLQQEANRKLGFTARRTMSVAQSLYENGHITYMRTDSTNLAEVAITAARELVRSEYGPEYLPPQPRIYKSKVKNAQEAHEAIRPAGHPFQLPEALRGRLNTDEFRLFEMIWKRTIASQMTDSRGRRMVVTIEAEGAIFQARGKTIDFPGYLRAYVEGSDDPVAELENREMVLPPMKTSDQLNFRDIEAKSHTTQPPARFTEASLTQALEQNGIGRPSTYATTIDTIINREYVYKRGSALVPSWMAFSVCSLLEQHLPKLVDYAFTAQMEDDLDAISRGEVEYLTYLENFYFGNSDPGLKAQLANKVEEIDARAVSTFPIGTHPEGDEIQLRVGRYGPFLEWRDQRASLPDDLPPDELTIAKATEFLAAASKGEEPLGHCPQTGKPIFLKQGRFGPYVQLGSTDDDEKPKNASLLKGMSPDSVTIEVALKLLSLPATLGNDPTSGQPVVASNGRFGPYVKCGNETRSLPSGWSPIDVTLEQALELLAKPKLGRGRAAPKEPIKVFEASPVTQNPVQLLEGRYGPYVTDGTTNASVPKGVDAADVTLPMALQWLADRAAREPAKRRGRGAKKTAKSTAAPAASAKASSGGRAKKSAKKSATKKSAAPKSATKKTTAKASAGGSGSSGKTTES